jgi:hypothetical protein
MVFFLNAQSPQMVKCNFALKVKKAGFRVLSKLTFCYKNTLCRHVFTLLLHSFTFISSSSLSFCQSSRHSCVPSRHSCVPSRHSCIPSRHSCVPSRCFRVPTSFPSIFLRFPGYLLDVLLFLRVAGHSRISFNRILDDLVLLKFNR